MSRVFEIKEHTIECQHIREYARATANAQEDILQLAIKQYIPLDNPEPKQGDITIIGAHANGFPKELYEPLWEELHARSKANGFRIRGIWIADVAHQGASGVLNENLIGNDPSWLDHSRDLLHMINHFRLLMPLPIIGIGHSWGAAQLANLSYMHPRLLSTVIFLDPVIQQEAFITAPTAPSPAQSSTFRRDLWPSHSLAITSFKRSPFYSSWDPRVLSRWLQYGIRPTPSLIYPNENSGQVTLTTTKHQEVLTFVRPSWDAVSSDGRIVDKEAVPDMAEDAFQKYPMYRPEPPNILVNLPSLRPSVLYIFGETSPMSSPQSRALKMKITGTGTGGSGGVQAGRVKEVVLEGVGHLVAMENVGGCADAAAEWIGREKGRWEEERGRFKEWSRRGKREKVMVDAEWKIRLGGPPKKPGSDSKSKL